MATIRRVGSRALFMLLAVLMLFSAFLTSGVINASAEVVAVPGTDSMVRTNLDDVKSLLTSIVYADYLAKHDEIKMAESAVEVDLQAIDPENTTASNEYYNAEDIDRSIAKEIFGVGDSEYDAFISAIEGGVLVMGDDGKVTFEFEVKESGFYNLYLEYFAGNAKVADEEGELLSGSSTPHERTIYIDGVIPFKETRSLVFNRAWRDSYVEVDENGKLATDASGNAVYYHSASRKFIEYVIADSNNKDSQTRPFRTDTGNNELRPDKELNPIWLSYYVHDSSGYYNDSLKFYLEEGKHTITITAIKEVMSVKSIQFKTEGDVQSYSDYISSFGSSAADYTGDNSVTLQAEYYTMTSEQTIYQRNDRTSIITQPQDYALSVQNEIGGDKWQYVGQWVEWVVTVPESGFYYIVPRSKQNVNSGAYSSRRLYINGEIPFYEASYLRFTYSTSWVTEPLNNGSVDENGNKEYFKFYFEAGKEYTLRLEAVLGDMSEVIAKVEDSLNTLNGYYRKVLMITGPTPDSDRDYNFHRHIPEVIKGLREEAINIEESINEIIAITGEKGEGTVTLDKVKETVKLMGDNPTRIAGSMSTLKDHLGNLGTWLTTAQSQPLYIDYFSIQSPQAELPQAEPGFFRSMWGELMKFFYSFVSDYNSIGSIDENVSTEKLESAKIEVWTTSSREIAQIIRNLVDENYMSEYGLPVEVKLVVAGTLLPATLAGTGPDVNMGNGQGDPVNYAIRTAVKSMNHTGGDTKVGYNFNDFSTWADMEAYKDIVDRIDTFDETIKRFPESSVVPVTLYGETYGIPETLSVSMMYYRKDIFVELGIEVPNTWDDFYSVVAILRQNMLDIGFPTGIAGSTILMYQVDEPMYDEGNYENYLLYMRSAYSDDELYDMGYIYDYTYTDDEGNAVTEVRPATDGMTINLDSDVSVGKFNQVCQLFTAYQFPVTYDFANRFRQGSMPLAIGDAIGSYNLLTVFAPEIKGLWEYTPLPGTLDEATQTINNTTVGTITAMTIMRSVTNDNALAAWSFIQWWTRADTQSAYANEMIALLGPSAKQSTANIEALENMAWSKDEYDNLSAQYRAVQCTPEFPGNYIIGRHMNFAFLDVVNKGNDPVDEMQEQISDINNELSRKRTEFGLPTKEIMDKLQNDYLSKQGQGG